MTETQRYPDPDPDDEAIDEELEDLLDEDLEADTGESLPPHGDIFDDEEE